MLRFFIAALLLILSLTGVCQVYPTGFKKISNTTGGFAATLNSTASFGILSTSIGDLDNDGVLDLAVGATNQGGFARGSVFILFMKVDGTVKITREILPFESGQQDSFGSSLVPLGDMDHDGVEDLGIGAGYDSDGGETNSGSFWITFLNSNGTVKSAQKISNTSGNLGVSLPELATFGTGAASLGDLDNDGVVDIAVGSYGHGIISGAVYILFLNSNGTVKNRKVITQGTAGLSFASDGYFGYGLGALGDVDGDGVMDIAVGGHRMDDGGTDRGALWVIFLKTSGDVKGFQKISATAGNFNQVGSSRLGVAVDGLGDYDGDGVRDLLVGGNDGSNTGAIWYVMLNSNGTVKSAYKISGSTGNTNLTLDSGDFFGGSITSFGSDIDGDGIKDVAIGAFLDDDGNSDSGAMWISIFCGLQAKAGPDQSFCDVQTGTLDATAPTKGSGAWSVLQGSASVTNPGNPTTPVTNLSSGLNKFLWTVSYPGCPSVTDTVRMVTSALSAAIPLDTVLICRNRAKLEALVPSFGSGTWSIISGNATLDPANDPSTEITLEDMNGSVDVVWTVSHTGCVPAMDTLTIVPITLKPGDLPNVITPNGDGKNDYWKIKKIELFPGNDLRLYNRWGQLVFSATNYKNDWDGGGLTNGIYYYFLNAPQCGIDIKGSLHIIH